MWLLQERRSFQFAIAGVGLWGPEAGDVGWRLRRHGDRRRPVVADADVAGFCEQLLEDCFALLVFAFAELMMANMPLGIDAIQSRPILVIEGVPYGVVVVERDRIVDPHVLDGPAHIVEVVLEGELGCMHADDDQAVILVFGRPRADIGKGAAPIDAGVGPEIDQ